MKTEDNTTDIIDYDSETHQIIKIGSKWELQGKYRGRTYFISRSIYRTPLYALLNQIRVRNGREPVTNN